jgi:inosine-uridine nucleoside N-ribohydrolase
MRRALKRILKRIFIFIVIAFLVYLVVSNISFFRDLTRRDRLSLIIDTDLAQGQDDRLALVRVLLEDEVTVEAVLSAQWRLADLDNDSTVRMNMEAAAFILKHFNRSGVSNLPGAGLPLASLDEQAIKSNRASAQIIKRASETPAGEKMKLVCLGPATNLACALITVPDVAQKISCYVMGPWYEPSNRVWNKNEQNTRNDLAAMDILLNTKELELHIMPATIARDLVLDRSQSLGMFPLRDSLFDQITSAWRFLDLKNDSIPMGSLALIEAILHPEMSSKKQVITPPENVQRKVHVYTRIDAARMKKDLRNAIDDYRQEMRR